ncbi:hypothetical protein ACJMK2_007796, partial [Sinanodonta woodiana]
ASLTVNDKIIFCFVLEGQGELFVTLNDLLAFTTGADEVPAHGFNFPLQLSFIRPEDLNDVAKCCTAGIIHPEDL